MLEAPDELADEVAGHGPSPAGSPLVGPPTPAGLDDPPQTYWRESLSRLLHDPVGVVCGATIAVLGLLALFAPLVAGLLGHEPETQSLLDTFAPPSAEHWLGTDELGRDTLVRLLYGMRLSLVVAVLTVAVSVAFGALVGIVAGYLGGWVDEGLMRCVDAVLALPAIFLFIFMSILFRPNIVTLALILASVSWVQMARLVRGEVLVLREADFVTAARSIGAGRARIMARHLVPAVLPVVIVAASLAIGQIILAQSALDFLGLGVQPPTPSLGNMLTNAQTTFQQSTWLVVAPGLAIFAIVLVTTLFGNALRDALDPRLR